MDKSDLLVTKARPGTIAEAISRELPIIVYYWVPGQEVGNTQYIKENKIGYVIKNTKAIVEKINLLNAERTRIDQIRKNIKKIQTPTATYEIARKIISYA